MTNIHKKLPTMICLAIFVSFLCLPNVPAFAQEPLQPPPQNNSAGLLKELEESGRPLPGEVEEAEKALREGKVNAEEIERLQKEGKLGTLTVEEIEAGKRKLEGWQQRVVKEKKKEPVGPKEERFKKKPLEVQRELEIFGHELFSKAPSTFAPIESVPVSSDYIIGPGDELEVLMWGRLDKEYTLEVDTEGVIQFPKIGPLTVAGLTYGELKEVIKRKAEAITGVNVNVSMGKLRTIQVFVLGEVKNPGVYTVSALATAVNALLSSGGPTRLGSLRKVQLKRNGKIVTGIDLYDLLLKGDTTADSRLMPRDVIFVPQTGPMVKVSGNVKRPAIYELKGGKNLQRALNLAGGLAPRAYNQRIQIERPFKHQKEIVLDIPYEKLKDKKTVSVQDGDLIKVFSILPSSVNAVYLYGNVRRPGKYAYRPGLCLMDVLPDLENLKKDTYFDYALVKRYHRADMETELIPFDLGRLLHAIDESQNLSLQPEDEIYVFSRAEFEDKAYATIEGEVRRPDRYVIDQMKIKDLIFRAGNLTRDAYLEEGHLYRTDPGRNKVTLHTFNVKESLQEDPEHNLPLQDLDRVIIHNIREYQGRYTVSIRGMVNNPGEYPYATDMTVRDLILVAGNVKSGAYMGQAELVRQDIIEGKKVQTSVVNFNVRNALEDDLAHNLRLQPMDVVRVKEIPEWGDIRRVSITGEVGFPGAYEFRKDEHLSSVIQRAGGFTEYAYLRGAVFARESVRKIQQKRLDQMMERLSAEIARLSSKEMQTALSEEDLAAQQKFLSRQKAILDKLRGARASGRVVINLCQISEFKGSPGDIALEDGDVLHIPREPQTVNVLGEVYNPTTLTYESDRPRVKYYLARTGGPTENAKEDEAYIIRADGTVVTEQESSRFDINWNGDSNRWEFGRDFDDIKLYPGDTILVPQKVIYPARMRDIKDITQILYQIAVTAGITVTQVF